jgi:hypothetical protein
MSAVVHRIRIGGFLRLDRDLDTLFVKDFANGFFVSFSCPAGFLG